MQSLDDVRSAPGRRVDVGGYCLHLQTAGEGTPSIILESGLGDNSLVWSLVQPEVAKFAHVVSYDRAGLGWSDASPHPRTSEFIAGELHALLLKAGIPAPYVLVGHSMGGIHVRQFAHTYPDVLAGMVLVDSAHENGDGQLPDDIQKRVREIDAGYVEQFKAHALKSREELLDIFQRHDDQPNPFLPEIAALQRDRIRPSIIAAVAREIEMGSPQTSRGDDALNSLGDLPLLVLSQADPEPVPELSEEQNAHFIALAKKLQSELAAISTNSRHVQVNCGHYIHVGRPQTVIDAIREVVEAVRTHRSIRASAPQ